LILILPALTDYLEVGHLPGNPREVITETVLTIAIGLIIAVVFSQLRRLEDLSTLDHLTGIRNRRQFEIDLQQEILRAKRMKLGLGLLFFDLNRFKEINDRYGHKAGDRALIQFAQGLSRFARKGTDYCYRLGGDEFIVMLTNIKNDEIDAIESRIEERLMAEVSGRLPYGLSASKGFVIWKADETHEELLRRADAMMYREKGKRDAPARPS